MKIKVITNFNSLDTKNQKKIYEDLGSFLALAYLEQLKVLPIDSAVQTATLKLNTYEAKNTDNQTSSPQLQSSPNECSSNQNNRSNTHLPINENSKFSKPTEGQIKD